MRRPSTLYGICRLLKAQLPCLTARLRFGLGLWVQGTLVAENSCQDSVAQVLETCGPFETVRRALREWLYDDGERITSWGPDQEVEVEACFPALLHWVRAWWVPQGPLAEEPLVLAVDPTFRKDELVALVISVLYRNHAIPVAWYIVGAQEETSWIAHICRLLCRLAPAVPVSVPVPVLCDMGLGSRDLWDQIVAQGWHPCMRYQPHITFHPEGQSARQAARTLVAGPGEFWVGNGRAFRDDPLPCTLVVLHARDEKDPWILLTDTPPAQTDATLYACRAWIEQGFRGLKTVGWQWHKTRRLDPVRVARHWLVLAVATLLALAYGTRAEEARVLGRPPGQVRQPPSAPVPLRVPRRFSLLRQGTALLRARLLQGRLWARVWLRPRPGPDRTAGLRCVSPTLPP